jgi:NAD(P) transhydrogenase
VAGLAAIQTAKNMGAVVRAFDVRPVTKEQVEAMGGQFLEVNFKEDGSGAGGYAKEMSPEWHAAAAQMLSKQCEEVDVIITTALIPGRKAPIMITKEMIAKMKSGSVTVDLAAESGGNVETTVEGSTHPYPQWRNVLGIHGFTISTSHDLVGSLFQQHFQVFVIRGTTHDKTSQPLLY